MTQHPHTIIIAEIGVNHQGSVDMALKMIDTAAEAGVDYVKFQTFKAENLVCASAERAGYQKANCGGDDSQLDMLRRYELTADDFRRLSDRCRERGVGFMSSPFDLDSIELLAPLGMDFWKIPSGEITNLPYLRDIARHAAGKARVILSTGMSTEADIDAAIKTLTRSGLTDRDIILLHCTTQYPTPPDQVNLLAMNTLHKFNPAAVGLSDHTEGITVATAAVALGAGVIEKHFTLDKSLPGPDHKASLNPGELRALVKSVRTVELALGSPVKQVAEAETANRPVARKSIVARKAIAAGETFTDGNLTVKRPGTGLSPMLWDSVIGRTASRDFLPDELITL